MQNMTETMRLMKAKLFTYHEAARLVVGLGVLGEEPCFVTVDEFGAFTAWLPDEERHPCTFSFSAYRQHSARQRSRALRVLGDRLAVVVAGGLGLERLAW